MKLLITGGFGFLGGRLAQYLERKGNYEIVLGSRNISRDATWLHRANVVQVRWDSSASLDEICKGQDAIVHLAGMNAQASAADPVAALQVNAVNTARLLQAAVREKVKRFVYLSTAHVYGSPLAGVITEQTCPASLHPYAASHRAGEDAVRAMHQEKKIEGVVVRLSNAFGAPAHEGADCWMLLANDLCLQAVTTRRIVLRTSGLQQRDFITLTNACKAIGHLLELPAAMLKDGLFNVGSGKPLTVLEMAERIAARFEAVTGEPADIYREQGQRTECQAVLDYGIKKLMGTGFCADCKVNSDAEIDDLLKFCLAHLKQ